MNEIARQLGIRYPIIQGGMGNASNAILAAAVSNAGGLGMIGAGTMSPEEVERIIVDTKQRTSCPFGVNIAINVSPYVNEIIQLIIKHGVKAVSLSAGNPAPYIPLLKEHGITILSVAASVLHARKAESAGADMIVGEGYEAAGINSHLETTTFALIPQLADAVRIPIIAAGGIGDGRGLAAALALGASGVQMGTRLIATKESMMHEHYIASIIESHDFSTKIIGKSVNQVRRVLPTPYVEHILQLEKEGLTAEQYRKLTAEKYHVKAAVEGKLGEGFINSGQISGLIQDVPSVEALIQTMAADAIKKINEVQSLLK
ncbi:DUF561 domain-containing protein [Jeotgalibacillus sp. S-D1]|uniref:NAD(P)H-dependent flavin oxidoreductase n=1 Tax=Jeotgalibacillus sp. S-D1 TaxID=2552189 RepID=UPI001059DF52|nr:DUF561 domain-containing protein [Jeotgalibacillus sp. S-D1]TDL35265.1 DUF561 domain-containing protein [Jeotgalibacillus sp. S-D1]